MYLEEWALPLLFRVISAIVFGFLILYPNDSQHLASYGVRIQQSHAQSSITPAMYPDPSIELWIRSLAPVSIVSFVISNTLSRRRVKSEIKVKEESKKNESLIWLLLATCGLDLLTLVFSVIFFEGADSEVERVPECVILAILHALIATANLQGYIRLISHQNSGGIQGSQVQLLFGFAIEAGLHVTLSVASVIHAFHSHLSCQSTKSEEDCETVLLLGICVAVTCLLALLSEIIPNPEDDNTTSDKQKHAAQLGKVLWRQFSLFPTAIVLLGLDRNASAGPRIASVAGVTASAILVFAMATTLAKFFDPDNTTDTTVDSILSKTSAAVYRPTQNVVRRSVRTKVM